MVTREARNNAPKPSTSASFTESVRSGWRRSWAFRAKEAETYISNYFERYSGVRNFIDDTIAQRAPHRRDEDFVRPRAPYSRI